ncbi:DNA polymerase III subunit gamma/tau [Candidatus Dependentiae bacterium]|nr:DNA polymerase III subunit gamma/tau [Candidatus Dependentiae bacterium]
MQLNLARKWRSKQFNEVIGQELAVRLIKNSLYRSIFFPVYLFAGMRGCGKTTTARLFATAINCEQLPAFQENPQQIALPCLVCLSCKAMQMLQHPDFIEIDAASHTGVDNVRALIDTASFVPALGRKKIYLIDEAHMLSKAAFNALLKILEEPPASVIFMLATTDFYKILDTVRSRCFQLFFSPLSAQEVMKHLAFVCTQEAIPYEPEALALIAYETEGSARDALNMLEKVRLTQSKITKAAVISTLGFIDDERLVSLFKAIVEHNCATVVTLCATYNLKQFNAQLILKKCIELIRTSIWLKSAVPTHAFKPLQSTIRDITHSCQLDYLVALLELCYSHELTFLKTTTPDIMLEMLFLKMCSRMPTSAPLSIIDKQQPSTVSAGASVHTYSSSPATSATDAVALVATDAVALVATDKPVKWSEFIQQLSSLDEPLLASIFQQSHFIRFDQIAVCIEIAFAKNALFYKEWLDSAQTTWKPVLDKLFGEKVQLSIQLQNRQELPAESVSTQADKFAPIKIPKITTSAAVSLQQAPKNNSAYKSSGQSYYKAVQKEVVLVVADSQAWPQASLLISVFPGTITHRVPTAVQHSTQEN